MSYSPIAANNNSSLSEPLNTTNDVVRAKPPPSSIENSSDDPFYVFREDLYRKLELVDEALTEFLRVVHQTDTSVNTQEFKDVKKQLKRHIKNAECTLNDVQTTIDLVESDPSRFSSTIDKKELYNRKTFLNASHNTLLQAKNTISSDSVKEKLLNDEKARIIRRNGDNTNGTFANINNNNGVSSLNNNHNLNDPKYSDNNGSNNRSGGNNRNNTFNPANNSNNNNDDFIVDSQARTSLLFQQQEETLGDLESAVTRVGYMAGNIHDEINSQNKILNDMDDDLADAEEKLGLVMGKLAKVLKTKSRWQLCTIIGLSVAVIILFFLVIYT